MNNTHLTLSNKKVGNKINPPSDEFPTQFFNYKPLKNPLDEWLRRVDIMNALEDERGLLNKEMEA